MALRAFSKTETSLLACRLLLLMGGFLLFFTAFFTVHAIFKVQNTAS